MERIFINEGLPSDLTRMAFVESMFNLNARSKAGASGIWQFMPRTARRFMIVNRFVDERNSPIKATRGAAKLLKHNYRKLGSWPLAITAYNHGVAGMSRAVRKTRTTNFDKIIDNYKSRTFGFASRNFYAEFIAARNVYNKFYDRGVFPSSNPLGIEHVKLSKKVSISQLLRHTPITKATLKKYNGCILPRAFKAKRKVGAGKSIGLLTWLSLSRL